MLIVYQCSIKARRLLASLFRNSTILMLFILTEVLTKQEFSYNGYYNLIVRIDLRQIRVSNFFFSKRKKALSVESRGPISDEQKTLVSSFFSAPVVVIFN